MYLLFAAEPYEVIAFKVPNSEVDKSEGKLFTHWDPDNKIYSLQYHYRNRGRCERRGAEVDGGGVRSRGRQGKEGGWMDV